MKFLLCLHIISLIWVSGACGAEHIPHCRFIFPIEVCKHKSDSIVFFMDQTSLYKRELWQFNTKTHQYDKALFSLFIPTALHMLPDKTGFSFLHNDTIYIKRFYKRSPKRIEFYQPLYGINMIGWIDNKRFYFFAKEHRRFRIYQATIEGDVQTIISDEDSDALYPQKVNDQLFYIERTDSGSDIIETSYIHPEQKKSIYCVHNSSIGWLQMISPMEGFFVQYKPSKKKEEHLFFAYHHLIKSMDHWQVKILFSFAIPRCDLV